MEFEWPARVFTDEELEWLYNDENGNHIKVGCPANIKKSIMKRAEIIGMKFDVKPIRTVDEYVRDAMERKKNNTYRRIY